MKLNEYNSRFAVVLTALHGGGAIEFCKSLQEAMKTMREVKSGTCICGCCDIVPITEEARDEMIAYRGEYGQQYFYEYETLLYSEIPENMENGEHYSLICK